MRMGSSGSNSRPFNKVVDDIRDGDGDVVMTKEV